MVFINIKLLNANVALIFLFSFWVCFISKNMILEYFSKGNSKVMNESWGSLNKFGNKLQIFFKSYFTFLFVLSFNYVKSQSMHLLAKSCRYHLNSLVNKWRQKTSKLIVTELLIPRVRLAKSFWIPSGRISTIATPCHPSLHSNSVAIMISVSVAFIANDASWILLTIFAFPSNIFSF